jgi:hypothetical protein
MSISPITTTYSSATAGVQSSLQQRRNEFEQLSQALQSGDLSAAQKAYISLTQVSSNSSFSSNQNRPLAQDFQALGKALQSGDLQGAQTAFAQFQKDASAAASQSQQTRGASEAHRGHHRRQVDADNDGDSSGSTDATTTTGSTDSSNGSTKGTIVNLLA